LKRKFFRKLILFAIIVGLTASIPVGVAIYSGEAMPLGMVIDMQSDGTTIYNPFNDDLLYAYKMLSIQTYHPEIITIGSSRMHNYRAAHFNQQPELFYSFSGSAWRFNKVTSFIEQVEPDYAPKVVIIGLDQFWFNGDSVEWNRRNLDEHYIQVETNASEVNVNYILTRTRLVWENILNDDIEFSAILERRVENTEITAIGLKAIQSGLGHRSDGALYKHIPVPLSEQEQNWEQALNNHIRAMGNREKMYQAGHSVSQEALDNLNNLLQTANEKGIIIIGFFPPFRPSFYEEMMASGDYTYMPQASEQVAAIFEQYGAHFFDYSNAAWIGGTDESLWDSWHPTGLFAAQIYIELLKALPDVLGEYSDLDYLQNVVDNAENPFDIWSDAP
jgi:hypothetical protein